MLTDFWETSVSNESDDLVRLLPDSLFATNLAYNVEMNGLGEGGTTTTVQRLDWHNQNPNDLGDFDLVIGSDLVYNTYDVAPLLSVLDNVLNDKNCILLFIPLPPAARREALPLFLEELDLKREW
eukprot:CAMPEP_0118641702 /NCGR_PEP_ID=MMETSP0785-20121206/5441_1 /TAXON_ID=91992 /ORGANISM="Bolidomonas pacifica, Strain CCMP 1866" /LENGTH=124 /DNA_ID=CAMNT_0006533201 /DNA_START=523 /DNA_END=894 /DNA_ORIENTATION=-